MLNFLFRRRCLKGRSFILLLIFLLVLDFAPYEMQDVGLPSQKVRVAKNVFARVFAAFVKAIHIELSDERVDIPVPEELGKNMVLEVVDLFDGKLAAVSHPMDYGLVLFVLENLEAFLNEISYRIISNLT